MTRYTVTFDIDADLDNEPLTGPEFRWILRSGLNIAVLSAATAVAADAKIVPGSVRTDYAANLTVLDRSDSSTVIDALRLVADIYAVTNGTGRPQRPVFYRDLADRLDHATPPVAPT